LRFLGLLASGYHPLVGSAALIAGSCAVRECLSSWWCLCAEEMTVFVIVIGLGRTGPHNKHVSVVVSVQSTVHGHVCGFATTEVRYSVQ
jgi:hypothetical protein